MQTIALKGDFVRKEVEAAGAITPGMGVGLDGLVAGADTPRKAFALENDLVGKGIADAYAIGDTVQLGVFSPGAEVAALAGAAIVAEDVVVFDATGRLIPQVSQANPIGVALEAAALAGDRVKVEVL